MLIPFAEWRPDAAALAPDAGQEAFGVVPTSYGYGPAPRFAAVTSAITARAQGAISVRDLAGAIHNFCGDATKLYKMAADGLSWANVSNGGGAPYACPSDGQWNFFQFGNSLIAINGVDAAQVYTLGGGGNFAALGGSSPVANFGTVVRGFGVMGRIASAWNRVQWSGIEDVTTWASSATTLSDAQDIPEGGAVMGMTGGEYGVVFQERAVTRMSFEGPPTAFRFDKISNTLGCRASGSIAAYKDMVFWLSDDGFYQIDGGLNIIHIGAEKIDRWFEDEFDGNYPYRITSCIDPIRKLYVVSFPDGNDSDTPNQMLFYHWPTQKWSRAGRTHEMVYAAANQSSYTLDTLDTLSGSLDALTLSLDSRTYTGSGRLQLSGFDTLHKSGFFDGAPETAVIDTGDIQLIPGRKSLVRSFRPVIQGAIGACEQIFGYVGYRDRQQDSLTSTSLIAATETGMVPVRSGARYHRFKIQFLVNDWDHAIGIDDVKASPLGRR